jgi:hypothetical protein
MHVLMFSWLHVQITEGTALAKNTCLLRTLLPVVDSSHQYVLQRTEADWCCVPGSTLIPNTGALFLKWQRTHLTALSTLS